MTYLGRFSVSIGLVAAALFAVGCGETVIDDAKTEAAIEQNLEQTVGQEVSSVDCPSGVEVETDASFDCEVTLAGGKQQTATLRILNEDADVEVTGLQPNK